MSMRSVRPVVKPANGMQDIASPPPPGLWSVSNLLPLSVLPRTRRPRLAGKAAGVIIISACIYVVLGAMAGRIRFLNA